MTPTTLPNYDHLFPNLLPSPTDNIPHSNDLGLGVPTTTTQSIHQAQHQQSPMSIPHPSHKFNADGPLSRYKARLVANGRSQQQGIDCDKTFRLAIHHLDVKNDFLHGHLTKTVYMHQLPGFVDLTHPDYSKVVEEILERAHMQKCNPCKTHVDIKSKLGHDGDPTLYHSLACALQYLTFTRPDLSYVVQQ
ncbi:ribonuclease H-like domain-containing protein, partial [Tanacetum coccineum]